VVGLGICENPENPLILILTKRRGAGALITPNKQNRIIKLGR
jgi:hypothetical protein